MPVSADTLAELMKAGVTGEALLSVVRSIDRDMESGAKVRSSGAERQARYRAKQRAKAESVTSDVTSDVTESVTEVTPEPEAPRAHAVVVSNNIFPQNTTCSTPTEKSKPRKSNRGTRLPDDWNPTDGDWRTAVQSLGEPRANSELAKFRDYWRGRTGAIATKLDWDATWRNWVRTAAERPAPRLAFAQPQAPPIHEPIRNAAPVSREEMIERAKRAEALYEAERQNRR